MHKLTREINQFIQVIESEYTLPNKVNSTHVARFALAMNIAYRLDIPASEVYSVKEHFINNHYEQCEIIFSKLNEYVIVNIDEMLDITEKVYTLRYRLVHDPFSVVSLSAMIDVVSNDERKIADIYRDILQKVGAGPFYDFYSNTKKLLDDYLPANDPEAGPPSQGEIAEAAL